MTSRPFHEDPKGVSMRDWLYWLSALIAVLVCCLGPLVLIAYGDTLADWATAIAEWSWR